jgi:hypothetical protein
MTETPLEFVGRMYKEGKWRELTTEEATHLAACLSLMDNVAIRNAINPTTAFAGTQNETAAHGIPEERPAGTDGGTEEA